MVGAPEQHPGRRGSLSAVSQGIDIWSLGCVFSIAATWVVYGYQGISQFRKLRQSAILKAVPDVNKRQNLRQPPSDLVAGDYFHDSREVLSCVQDWHNVLRSALRKTDSVTSQVLDLVDRKMLRGDASSRIKAKDLCEELKLITARSQAQPRIEMPESLKAALIEMDDEAASSNPYRSAQQLNPSMALPDDRRARKSMRLDIPLMKTAHRSEGLRSTLKTQDPQPESLEVRLKDRLDSLPPIKGFTSHGLEPIPTTYPQPLRYAQSYSTETGHKDSAYASRYDQQVSPNQPRGAQKRRPENSTTQDVFQARDEIEGRNKKIPWRKTRKDELLTRHFRNRDLVGSLILYLRYLFESALTYSRNFS